MSKIEIHLTTDFVHTVMEDCGPKEIINHLIAWSLNISEDSKDNNTLALLESLVALTKYMKENGVTAENVDVHHDFVFMQCFEAIKQIFLEEKEEPRKKPVYMVKGVH
ncbi:MAG: hypothetical protein ACRCZZ_06885 [Phocaeicola sp.]